MNLLSHPLCAAVLAVVTVALQSAELPREYRDLADGEAADAVRLHKLFDLEWKKAMEDSPEAATYNGFPGFNDRWSDLSAEAIEQRKAHAQKPLAVLDKIDRSKLSQADQLNYDLFKRDLELDIEGDKYPGELMPINQMGGVQQDVAQMISIMPKSSIQDYEDIVARLRKAPILIDQTIALLRQGLEKGITPPRVTLRDVSQQMKNQVAESAEKSPLWSSFADMSAAIPGEVQERLRQEAKQAIEGDVIPAYRKLEKFFSTEYLPRTRESVAISDLPGGREWYEFNVRVRTTTTLTPQEIHEIGQAEVKRIRAEMDQLIKQTGFNGSFADFAQFLRTDARFFYTNANELISGYRDISKRADPELARLFGKLPRLPYGVLPIPAYAQKSQTTAYYQPGAAQFGRPGYFFANTYDLGSRPKWEMEALTLHEAVPGHHLQIALAQELENVPEFRKHSETTVFVEGWGLYAEKLGEEMGFYKDPYSKFGQLTYEMWRAIRLVVDTGIHALGWDRDRAIAFFKANAAKAEHDIVVEVDRYIVWPGQALAYKIGELKIRELRARAEKALGKRFEIRKFHDEVLKEGALPLSVLEERIMAWIDTQKS